MDKQTFLKHAIENEQILGLIPQWQIRKFLRYVSPQMANPQTFVLIRKLQIRKFRQNIAQLSLKTVLKVVILLDTQYVQTF